jgi:hypothetical protein
MYINFLKAIFSPTLTKSHNTLKDFNSTGFKPYGVIPSLSIMLEGKAVNVEVEVFDAPLDYNLLLGRRWIDSMHTVVSTLFRVLYFPHQEKVIAVNQLAFFNSDSCTSNIPLILKTPLGYENVGMGLSNDSTLMGTFPIPPPDIPPPFFSSINMISTFIRETPESYDPWIVHIFGECLHYGDQIPLSSLESSYQAIQSETTSPPSLCDTSPDLFHVIFPTDEMIMMIMSMEDTPWDDGNHCSILFLECDTIDIYQRILTPSIVVVISFVPESTHDFLYKGKLGNISPTVPLEISIKPIVMENFHIGASCSTDEVHTYKALFQDFCDIFSWSYEEMPGIDPDIVVHEIKTYPDVKPIQQRLLPVHPRKVATINLEVEKLLKDGFVYPMALTNWVSNLVSVNKKQGTIHVFVDYMNINILFPKKIIQPLLLTRLLMTELRVKYSP